MKGRALSRRSFLRTAGAVAAVAVSPRWGRAAGPIATLEEIRVISHQPDLYHGWPTLARRGNGELWITWSGGRDGHVCPFGRVDAMVSRDEGGTWHWPQTLLDSPLDDRDSGVVETARGSLIVTTFTSLAYEAQLASAVARANAGQASLSPRLKRWQLAQGRLTEAERKAQLGEWAIRSTDGGLTWSTRIPTVVNSPHGPVQLRDGRLLYAGKQLWTEERKIGVAQSTDDGASWQWLAEIPARPGDDARQYHELHAVEAANGRLIAQLRNHNRANAGETLQAHSEDGGRTWSKPVAIGVWGLPSHLLRLRDGRLLMTYGHRRAPFGNQARLSEDHGATWSEPLLISTDGSSSDLGYPSTVERGDGSLLTVWYELLKGVPNAVLRQATWRIG